jgi:hypothetical protein
MTCEELRGHLKSRVPAQPHLSAKMKIEERRRFFSEALSTNKPDIRRGKP